MEVIVHAPESPEQAAELRSLAAKIHAQHIAYRIDRLSCPPEQKKQLLDAVIRTMRSQTEDIKK